MDASTVAATFAATSAAKVQIAAAAKMMKMNAEAAQSLVAVVQENADNLAQIARVTAAGVGGNVDVTV